MDRIILIPVIFRQELLIKKTLRFWIEGLAGEVPYDVGCQFLHVGQLDFLFLELGHCWRSPGTALQTLRVLLLVSR